MTPLVHFPQVVGVSDCPFIDKIQDKYKKIISKYEYDHNGFCKEAPHSNKKFSLLNKWIDGEVDEFIKLHEYEDKFVCKDSWIYDYQISSNQPYHNHPGYVVSTVFFLEGYEDDSGIIFTNPVADMKNALGEQAAKKPVKTNIWTNRIITHPPKSGRLFIWRSYLMHGVKNKVKDCKRIIFAHNYDKK